MMSNNFYQLANNMNQGAGMFTQAMRGVANVAIVAAADVQIFL